MGFIVLYVFAFFICTLVGNVLYLKSDKGIFTIIGLIPYVNIMVAAVIVLYAIYLIIDLIILDHFRDFGKRKGRYSKVFDR